MRWFNTLALATCLVTVVVAQSTTPAVTGRLPILRQPLIKLAVQPTIASDPLTVAAAPVGIAAQGIYPYGAQFGAQYGAQYGGQYGAQVWPGYLPQQNWYNPWSAPTPYWGGYPSVRRNSWNPYWRRRQVVRIPNDNTVTPQVEPQTTSAEVTPEVVEPIVDVADAVKPAEETNDAANTSAETAEEVPVVPDVPEVPLLIAANPAEAAEEVPLLIAANPVETSDSAAEAQPAVDAANPAEESNQAEATDASASA